MPGCRPWGMLQTVLTLHLLHGFAFIALPWGGATAMLRSAFHDYGIAGVLGTKVLDDFPLGQRLLRFGIRTVPVATAILDTHLTGQTMGGWNTWLTRQLLYLKYCLPSTWLASALVVWVLAGPILLAVLAGLGGVVGLVPPPLALMSLGFLLTLTAIGAWCRTLVPQPAPLGPWLLAFYANIFMACWCYIQDLAHRHHRLARHLLPGHLGRQGAENYPHPGIQNGTPDESGSQRHITLTLTPVDPGLPPAYPALTLWPEFSMGSTASDTATPCGP